MNSTAPEIIYFQDNLFLNCPKCKGTAYLDFTRKDPSQISINCYRCNNQQIQNLDDYMSNLSALESPTEVKCEKHNTYLDKFCYKCHKQFCSQCDMNNHTGCTPIKKIEKIINKEKVEEIKKMINESKEYFKSYINSYVTQYLVNQPQASQEFILEGLVIPYIQKMIYFFHFCDCILMNYNIDYPDFYQQMNLKSILSIFKTKIELMSLNSTNVEYMFNYEDNNYFSKHRVKLVFKETKKLDDIKGYVNYFIFNDEIKFANHFQGIKIYKNGNCINTIPKRYNEVLYHKIDEENIAVIQKSTVDSSLTIFSTKYNEVITTKNFNVYRGIFNLDDGRFGFTSSSYTAFYKIEGKELIKVSEKEMERPSYDYKDSIQIPGTKYIATLYYKEIILYNKDDMSFIKSINLGESNNFSNFYIDKSGRIFLAGFKIGIFDINKWTVKTIHDDNIKRFKDIWLEIKMKSNIQMLF